MRNLYIIILYLFISLNCFSQIKLYRGIYSGMSNEEVEEIISNDDVIQKSTFYSLYETYINNEKKIYGISFWTKTKYSSSEYSANIPGIIKDFTNLIEETNGKPQTTKKIPICTELRQNTSYQVNQWLIKNKYISIVIDNVKGYNESEVKYFVRLSIVDDNLVSKTKKVVDF